MNSSTKWLLFASAFVVIGMLIVLAVLSALFGRNHNSYSFSQIFSVGKSAELRNTIEISLSDIDSLDVSYGSKNLNVYEGDNDKIVIKEYLINDEPEALAETEIHNRRAKVTGSYVPTFNFWSFLENERIDIYVPSKGLENLSISTGSGNIIMKADSFELTNIDISTGSGNLNCRNITANEAAFNTGSGNVTLDVIKAKISIGTGSGNINGKNMEGFIEAGVSSGNIDISDINGYGDFKTTSGNVIIRVSKLCGDLNAKTGSGDAKVKIPKDTSGKVDIKT